MVAEIKAKLVLDTSSGGLGGSAGGGTSSSGLAGAASGGGLSKSMGGLGKILGLVYALLKGFKAPLLMIGQLMSMLLMFLKPISDVVVVLLRPVLMLLGKFLVKYLTWWNKTFGKEEPSGNDIAAANVVNPLVGTVLAFKKAKKNFEDLSDAIGADAKKAEGFLGDLDARRDAIIMAWEKLKDIGSLIWDTLVEKTQNMFDGWKDLGAWLWEKITEKTQAEIENGLAFIEWIKGPVMDWINKKWEDSKSLFEEVTEPVIKWITDNWTKIDDFSTMVWNAVKDWLAGAKDKIVDIIMGMIPSFFGGSKGDKGGGGSGEKKKKDEENGGFFSDALSKGKLGGFFSVKDALITSDGKVIQFDPKDDIMASKNGFKGMGGGNITVNVSINALDANSINSSLINNITSQITEKIKRETFGRTSYGVGI